MHRYSKAAAMAAAALVLCPGSARSAPEGGDQEHVFQETVRPYLKKYCVACHNAKVKTAGIALDSFASAESIAQQNGAWEKVLRKIRTGEMPPTGLPRAPQADTNSLVDWLGGALDRIAEAHPDPGRVTVHRLNRAEYNNAVRDLLAVEFRPADDFPADDSGYGFDNISDVLSLPPVLMEKYLSAAGKVSRQALGRVRFEPVLERVSVPRNVAQNHRLSEAAPIGTRGGIELEHFFPADADYLLRVRLRGPADNHVGEFVDVRLDGTLLERVEARIGTEEDQEEQRNVEVHTPVNSGPHQVLITFLRDDSKNESPRLDYTKDGKAKRSPIAVDWFEVGGPFEAKGPGDTESRRRILTCSPGAGKTDEACASEILARIARRAWRRPVTATETAKLMRFYHMGKQNSGEFEGGLELGLKAILVSPYFLFRVEREPAGLTPGDVYPVTGLELASRLSFFLWSSIPDETLLATAERGELKRPGVFAAQVRRMLEDLHARALTANFAGQWLHLRNLASLKPDPERFPEFDDDLRDSMRRETELFFESVVTENRSVLDFLSAPDTFLNERLARFYGVPGVEGNKFRRVQLPEANRGGVLTMASVLTVTSYPTRTSPVIRGKWVLENLLGAPPPPPPPDVPPLKDAGIGKTVSMRQQLEEHRANPSCAACHAKMDPIGFALENFDGIGRYRIKDGGFDVDTAGKLPSGDAFQNATELKQLLRAHPQEFVLCFTEKLLTYALGRGVERTDKPLIRSITRDAATDDYRFSSIVLGITNSAPFRMRRAVGTATRDTIIKSKEGLRAGD
jgi:cytochrome c551/c552